MTSTKYNSQKIIYYDKWKQINFFTFWGIIFLIFLSNCVHFTNGENLHQSGLNKSNNIHKEQSFGTSELLDLDDGTGVGKDFFERKITA